MTMIDLDPSLRNGMTEQDYISQGRSAVVLGRHCLENALDRQNSGAPAGVVVVAGSQEGPDPRELVPMPGHAYSISNF